MEVVAIPPGPSTIAYGIGRPIDDGTKQVIFAGDRRMMEGLGELLESALIPVVAEVPDYAIIEIRELPEA